MLACRVIHDAKTMRLCLDASHQQVPKQNRLLMDDRCGRSGKFVPDLVRNAPFWYMQGFWISVVWTGEDPIPNIYHECHGLVGTSPLHLWGAAGLNFVATYRQVCQEEYKTPRARNIGHGPSLSTFEPPLLVFDS